MSRMADGIHILHVDDDPDFADLVSTFLERENERFNVSTVTDTSDGLDFLAEHDVDCVISDYDMPRMNGIDFLEAVRDRDPDLPFVLYTGKGSEEIASDAISAGVTDYLRKEGGSDQYTVLANRVTNAVESYRARQALADRNRELRRYERMVNSMQEAACIYDPDGRFEIVNDYLADWYGSSPEQLEGEPSNLIPHIRDQADDGDPYQDLLDGRREQLRGELESAFPGHGDAVLEYQLTPLRVDGNIEGAVGVARDITERKRREQRLRQTTSRLEALFEGSPDMINIHDVDGSIIEPNPRLVEKTGYSEEELTGMNVWDIDQAITPEEATALWEGMDYGQDERLDGVYQRRDGSTFPVEVHVRRLRLEGEDRFMVISRDITERKERQRERDRVTTELRQHNERLEQFASIVSHDLRNPLNVADGQLELAREDCQSEHLDAIERAHDRMDTLIETLLTLAREGGTVTDREPVSLDTVIEECWANVATTDASLVVDIDRTVLADPSRLKQLFENLIRNGVEHGDGGVTITVGALPDGFYVADTGPGIPPDEREDVFEAGYSTSDQGTGYGLNIVKQIVDAHGWEIQITDGAEGGARFEITGVEFGPE